MKEEKRKDETGLLLANKENDALDHCKSSKQIQVNNSTHCFSLEYSIDRIRIDQYNTASFINARDNVFIIFTICISAPLYLQDFRSLEKVS